MIKAIVSDFSRTLLSPTDKTYTGGLNTLHESLKDRADYDIWEYYRLNQDLLAFYKTLGSSIDVYIFTTKYIQEWPPLKEKLDGVFKDIFSSARLGLPDKTDPQAYKIVAEKLELKPNEILYIDDKQENLDAAKEASMIIIRFESEQQTMKDVDKLIESFSS